MRRLLFCLAAGLACPAFAVAPISYDITHPGNGSYSYQDDGYTGTDTGTELTGGTGDLTDGVIAADHWYNTPQPMVGWANVAPVITFRFGGLTALTDASFFFDDAQGAGGVSLPVGVAFRTGDGVVAPTAMSVDGGGAATRYTYSFAGLSTYALTATIAPGNQWVMLSEVTFTGSAAAAVPEPAAWMMLLCGFGAIGTIVRRERRRTARLA